MKKRFQCILLCSCIIMSTVLAGCTSKNTLETEQENSGVSTEPSESESDYFSNSETESESANLSESASGSESENASESFTISESESSESEEPSESESDSQEPSESESETTKPSEEPSESQKPSNEEPSESESESKKPSKEEPYIVEYGYNEVTETFAYEKYGVKFYDRVHNFYNLYSDGSKVLVESKKSVTFDSTGYNATDEELLPETLEVVSKNKSLYEEALYYTNDCRARHKEEFTHVTGTALNPYTVSPESLTLSEDLCKLATMRAIEMYYANYFEHRRADGRSWNEFDCFNFKSESENCCVGANLPNEAVNSWEHSQGHFENMMGTAWTQVGFGYYNGYWVQVFGY